MSYRIGDLFKHNVTGNVWRVERVHGGALELHIKCVKLGDNQPALSRNSTLGEEFARFPQGVLHAKYKPTTWADVHGLPLDSQWRHGRSGSVVQIVDVNEYDAKVRYIELGTAKSIGVGAELRQAITAIKAHRTRHYPKPARENTVVAVSTPQSMRWMYDTLAIAGLLNLPSVSGSLVREVFKASDPQIQNLPKQSIKYPTTGEQWIRKRDGRLVTITGTRDGVQFDSGTLSGNYTRCSKFIEEFAYVPPMRKNTRPAALSAPYGSQNYAEMCGLDLHKMRACVIFDVKPSEVTKEMRQVGKTANLIDAYRK